ncbi:agamous-like MADS-box protein AGL80 [Curcuma longa]|uniref:agamous-like MADS-box protein AGL80 n=1 Tax=Curcuma longa TaxID=136217 RepID=UPI003D9F56C9
MARCKVRLVRIANDAIRRATLKKRLKGLMKKVRELTVLCDVEAAAVVYDPQHPLRPAVWPSRRDAELTFRRFRDMPEIQRRRKVSSHETFLLERVAKLRDQLRRLMRADRELEMSVLLLEGLLGRSLLDVSIEDASALSQMVDNKLREIASRREEVVRQLSMAPSPPPPPPPTPQAVPTLFPLPLQQSINWPPLPHPSPPPSAVTALMAPPLNQSMNCSSFSATTTFPSIQAPAPTDSHSHAAAAGNFQTMDEYSGATMNSFPWGDSLFF